MREFKIRSTAADALSKGLFVKDVTVDGASRTMSTALRVGVRYVDANNAGNNKAYIYGPVELNGGTEDGNKPSDNYKWYKDASDNTGSPVTLAKVGKTTSPILDEGTTISADTAAAVKVQIYVWFEGEDHNLFSDNFNTEGLNVTVQFSNMAVVGA